MKLYHKPFVLTMVPMAPNLAPGDMIKGWDEWYKILKITSSTEALARHLYFWERVGIWMDAGLFLELMYWRIRIRKFLGLHKKGKEVQ